MPSNRIATLQSTLDSSISREFSALRRRMHRLFGDGFAEVDAEPLGWIPAVDLGETDAAFTLKADLPGMKPADVTVECQDGTLTIKGEKSEEKQEAGKDNRWHLYERSYGNFYRSFAFPKPVDASKVSAQFINGVLTVQVPKSPETKPAARKIDIKTS